MTIMLHHLKLLVSITISTLSSLAVAGIAQAEVKPNPAIRASATDRSIAQASTTKPYRTETIPCPMLLPGETEGKTVTCGVLTVPENYDQPLGRQVEITYARFHSRSLSPLPDPVIYLQGGPGGSMLSNAWTYAGDAFFGPFRQTRDLVFFDQRGTVFSSRLGCAPTAFVLDSLGKQQFEQYVKRSADNDPLTNDETIAKYAICAQLLKKHGFDLNQFNTPNNARDVANLVAALGYNQVNLYSNSYGTYLAMAIMRNHPQVVRSVVLDSTAPPQVNKYDEIALRWVTPVVNLLQDCKADAACNQAYPNLQARLNALLAKLDKTPIPLPKVDAKQPNAEKAATSITLDSFAENLTTWINTQPNFPAYVPLMISELERGTTATYEQALSGKLFEAKQTPEGFRLPQYYQKLSKDFETKALQLLAKEANLTQTKRPSSQWLNQVQALIKTLPAATQKRAITNLYGVGYQTGLPRDRNTLMAFATETFPTQTALRKDLQTMSAVEVRHIYELLSLSIDQESPVDKESTTGMHMSFDCQDQVSWGSRSAFDTVNRSLPIPLLAKPTYSSYFEQVAICQQWSVKPTDPKNHQVLKSDIPTLVLQGRYDSQTSTDHGIRAMEGLTNGTYIEFPGLGHGLFLNQCGRDVGVAFINSPQIKPNASCKEALKPKFVLPPKSLK